MKTTLFTTEYESPKRVELVKLNIPRFIKAQMRIVKFWSKQCLRTAKLLKRKINSIRQRKYWYRQTGLLAKLQGQIEIIVALAKLDCKSPLIKSAGNGKRIDTVWKYVLICKKFTTNKPMNLIQEAIKAVQDDPTVKAAFIPKNGEVNGLRPLGVPGHITKLIERGFTGLLSAHSHHHIGGISNTGFRKGDSCHKTINELRQQVIKHPDYSWILLDQSGAFNSLNPETKQKLYAKFGIAGKAIQAFCERPTFTDINEAETIYDETGKAVVWYTGSESQGYSTHFIKKYDRQGNPVIETIKGLHGTPQGGVLSPLLFMLGQELAYQEIVAKHPDLIGVIYADDAAIGIPDNQIEQTEEILNDMVTAFSRIGLKMNKSKTETRDESGNPIKNPRLLGFTVNHDGRITVDEVHFMSRRGKNKDGRNPRRWETDILTILQEYQEIGRHGKLKAVVNGAIKRLTLEDKLRNLIEEQQFNGRKKAIWGVFNYYAKGISIGLNESAITSKDLGCIPEDEPEQIKALIKKFLRVNDEGMKVSDMFQRKGNGTVQTLTKVKRKEDGLRDWMMV